MSEGVFTLISSSGTCFQVNKEKAYTQSGTLKNLIDDGFEQAPCKDINDTTMAWVCGLLVHDRWPDLFFDHTMLEYIDLCNACLYLSMDVLRKHDPLLPLRNLLLQDTSTERRHTVLVSSWTSNLNVHPYFVSVSPHQTGRNLDLFDYENVSWTQDDTVQDHVLLRLLHKDVWKNYIIPQVLTCNKLMFKLTMTHPMLFDCVQFNVAKHLREKHPRTPLSDSQLMSIYLMGRGLTGLHHFYSVPNAKQQFCVSSQALIHMSPGTVNGYVGKYKIAFELYEALFKRYGTLQKWIAEREKREKRALISKEKRIKQKQEEQELREAKERKWRDILQKEPTLNGNILKSVRLRNGFDLELDEITPKKKEVKNILQGIRKRGRECVEQENWKLAYALLAPKEFVRVVKEVVSKKAKK